jgi:hypothetical protein
MIQLCTAANWMANTLETRTVEFSSEQNTSQQHSYQESNELQPKSYPPYLSTSNNVSASTPHNERRVQVPQSQDHM